MIKNISRIISLYWVVTLAVGCTGAPTSIERSSDAAQGAKSSAVNESSAVSFSVAVTSSSSHSDINISSQSAFSESAIASSASITKESSVSSQRSSSSIQSSQPTLYDECDNTAQCRELFGNSATDCKDSTSTMSWCVCGNAPCATANSSSTSSSEPTNPNGGASWGQGGEIGPRNNYPCTGCLFDTPDQYSHDTPTPLLITLHGDEGHPASIHRVYNEQPGFGKKAGFIVASLKCPKSLNCDKTASVAPGAVKANYSWWLWQRFIPEHDPNWINRQVNKIERQYNVDLSRVYLAGFSGGTTYISTWGVDNSNRYAGMILSAGGGLKEVETKACDQLCPLAVVISTGLDDFLHPNAKASRDFARRCGHELLYRETADKGHTFIGKDISEGLKWLLNRPHNCINSP